MTLADLLANENLRRHEFPVARDKIFLAHAGDCPLPRRVAEAVAKYARDGSTGDQERVVYPGILTEGRKVAGQLLGCQPEEVAFVGPTSLALSFIASGFKFRRGDNILIYFEDYPSNVYPWMALAEQGLEVRLLNTRGLGLIRPKDVLGQIDENTRLVALASCHFVSGYRLELEPIGKALRERGILFCVDAIQTVGAFPTDFSNADFAAASHPFTAQVKIRAHFTRSFSTPISSLRCEWTASGRSTSAFHPTFTTQTPSFSACWICSEIREASGRSDHW
jgi:selenocysteine lyase/cysteine desulfurase